ncbi:Bug family tripartite tricarboxylate transporter substrate binding protein [Caldovatus aquaticus]|uniref:Tripartite tricarboxylate transporter substrate binding protein n=1 Tax=Caldovatus aquaticus TaxID=2865671 RepID=A0ABS7F5K8_9PROT|nr:tripartite tricarboxylate transporter substrate binding protein [Caldovatus aquaticus]MBW8270769.1 tripartite tricarboxylate transporter substrate binding protein [Caldovatus aquaticus]
MPTARRAAFAALAAAAAAPAAARILAAPARAADWRPDRPVRLVVPFAPGGNTDLVARVIGPRMSERLGQPVVVENRAGAAGSVAAAQVARARPDGLTLMIGSNGPMAINPITRTDLGYEPLRDFAPLGLVVRTPLALAVHRDLPARDVAALIAHAKASPGRVVFGSPGVASTGHLTLEMFNAATGAGITHAPYQSGGALTPDLVAGTVAGAFVEVATVLPLHREGAVRILAVTAGRRLRVAPELPTVEEAGVPGFRAASFVGVVAPAGVPGEAMAALHAALAAAVRDPEVRRRLEEMGSEMAGEEEASPAGFAAFLQRETEWTRLAAERAGLRRPQ